MLMLLVGTTFAGHDWNTGSISNQLLFEPRRLRVWLAKLLAVGLVASALAAAVLFAHWTGLSAVSSARDLRPGAARRRGGVQAGRPRHRPGRRRGAASGYALTTLLRSTVGHPRRSCSPRGSSASSSSRLGFGGSERFMPWSNFVAFVVGGYTYYVNDSSCFSGDCNPTRHIDRADSVVYFLVILAAVIAVLGRCRPSRDVP